MSIIIQLQHDSYNNARKLGSETRAQLDSNVDYENNQG